MSDTFQIQNYNFNDINFIRDKKNYKIYIKKGNKNCRIRLLTSILSIPFGIEKYFNKYILNLSFFNIKENNSAHNFYSVLLDIDKYFMNIKDVDTAPIDLKLLVKDKTYMSCIRETSPYPPLLRTHIKIVKNSIITKFISYNDVNLCIPEDKIKNKKGYFTIELSGLWVNKDSYGLIWYLNGGKIY